MIFMLCKSLCYAFVSICLIKLFFLITNVMMINTEYVRVFMLHSVKVLVLYYHLLHALDVLLSERNFQHLRQLVHDFWN